MIADNELPSSVPSPELVKQRVTAVLETTITSISSSPSAFAQYGAALGLAGALMLSGLITRADYDAIVERAKAELPSGKGTEAAPE